LGVVLPLPSCSRIMIAKNISLDHKTKKQEMKGAAVTACTATHCLTTQPACPHYVSAVLQWQLRSKCMALPRAACLDKECMQLGCPYAARVCVRVCVCVCVCACARVCACVCVSLLPTCLSAVCQLPFMTAVSCQLGLTRQDTAFKAAAADVRAGVTRHRCRQACGKASSYFRKRSLECGPRTKQVENGKPAPDVFLRAAELLGRPPAECIVLEDAPSGAQGAEAAGMRVILVPSLRGTDAYPEARAGASKGAAPPHCAANATDFKSRCGRLSVPFRVYIRV
jgi:hypothetical protein